MPKIGAIPQVVNDPMSNLDVGDYLVSIESVKEESHDDGRLYYQAAFRVIQPASHQGLLHFERFWIGTEEDPEGAQAETWQKNAGRMKKCAEAVNVPFLGQNPDIVVQQMQNKQLCIKIIHKQGSKPREDGTFPTFANIQTYGAAGTMTPHVLASDNGSAPVGAPQQSAPAPAPAPAAGYPPQTSAPAPTPSTPVPGVGTGMPPVNPQQGVPAGSPLPPGAPQYQ